MEQQPWMDTNAQEQEYLEVLQNGLPPNKYGKKVVTIIGAGMAGLVAASLLRQAGHTVDVLEASERVGGRVLTLREPFTDDLYMEAGPMRVPSTHRLMNHFVQKFRLPISEFLSTTPNNIIYANGVKVKERQYERNPEILNFPLPPRERGKSASELFHYAVDPFLRLYNNASPEEKERLLREFDRYSFENFLLYNPFGRSISHPAIDMIGIIDGVRGFPELSFLQILFNIYQYVENPETTFYAIDGGFDRLPEALYRQLRDVVYFNEEVTDIVAEDPYVFSYTKTKYGQKKRFQADHTIITVPFTVLRLINVFPKYYFSYKKRIAISDLHYTTATKVGIEFRSRFWEREDVYGGTLRTDLPINVAYYPSRRPQKTGGPGVMIASYTWEDGTLPWDSLSEEGRIIEALDSIAQIHGDQVYREYVTGASKAWSQDPLNGGGDFAFYRPNQRTYLKEAIMKPEGRIHFAGEHASDYHGWIEGAIQSGVRTALEVHQSET